MTTKLFSSPHLWLESTSLTIAIVALLSSGVLFWILREHSEANNVAFAQLKQELAAAGKDQSENQLNFQDIEKQVTTLNDDLWQTKENVQQLQTESTSSQQAIQRLQSQIGTYQQQINVLNHEKQALTACVKDSQALAKTMQATAVNRFQTNQVNRSLLATLVDVPIVMHSLMDFNQTWNLEGGDCYNAQFIEP